MTTKQSKAPAAKRKAGQSANARTRKRPATANAVPHAILAMLPPPSLLPTENPDAFEAYREYFFGDVQPVGAVAAFFTSDAVDLSWEVKRYRRMRAELLTASRHLGFGLLLPESTDAKAKEIDRDMWGIDLLLADQGLEAARERVRKRLERAGVSMEQVEAATHLAILSDLERLTSLEERAQARLHACLQEIDRQNARLAARIRNALAQRDDDEADHGLD